jgi:hypothetical protein
MKSLKETALQIAVGYLGQSEQPKGSNRGPFVAGCLSLVGLPEGYAWCQAFVYRCFHEAARQLNPRATPGQLQQLARVVRTAGVLDCWNRTRALKITSADLVRQADRIQPGDQFIMRFKAGTGHTGIVERVVGDVLHTIEGNTNDEGSREGFEVARRERHISALKGGGIIQY